VPRLVRAGSGHQRDASVLDRSGVTAPNVVGQQVADATGHLAAEGLAIASPTCTTSRCASARLIRTVPGPGRAGHPMQTGARPGLSDGPAPRIVPEVRRQADRGRSSHATGHDGSQHRRDRPDDALPNLHPEPCSASIRRRHRSAPQHTGVVETSAGPAPTVDRAYLVAAP